MDKKPFQLKSGNLTSFKMMGSSPVKQNDGLNITIGASGGRYNIDKGADKFDNMTTFEPMASFNNPGNLGDDYKRTSMSSGKSGYSIGGSYKRNLFDTDVGRYGNLRLSGLTGGDFYSGNQSQSQAFQGASNFARGYGRTLFTPEELKAYESTTTMNPSRTNIFAGGQLDYSVADKNKFSLGGGLNYQRSGRQLVADKDAGVYNVFQTFDKGGFTNTIERGDKKIFSGPMGDLTGTEVPSYFDGNAQSKIREATKVKTYKEKGATSTFKPYLDVSASRKFNLGRSKYSPSATVNINYGTKYSPSSGFGADVGIKKGAIGGNIGYKQGKGVFAGLSLNIGGKKNK